MIGTMPSPMPETTQCPTPNSTPHAISALSTPNTWYSATWMAAKTMLDIACITAPAIYAIGPAGTIMVPSIRNRFIFI